MVGKKYHDLFVGPNLSKPRKGDEKFQELEELMEGAGLGFRVWLFKWRLFPHVFKEETLRQPILKHSTLNLANPGEDF